MPGGRLSQEERRAIGAGLGDGLGYAEIARRLGRPTSTVSREVARNSGPGGYRAEHAHHATGRRARRGTPRPGAGGAAGTADSDAGDSGATDPAARDRAAVDPAVTDFAEEFAAMMTANGLPRMAARVLARLFTTESGALTAAELVRQLRVSPASVSSAVGRLTELAVVRRERVPGRRQERYVLDDALWFRAWENSSRSHERWARAARRGVDVVGSGTDAGRRLARMARFLGELSEDMAGGSTAEVFGDAVAVTAALVQARVPITADRLAEGLGWEPDRVALALDTALAHAGVLGAVSVERPSPGTFTAVPVGLTAAQRAAFAPG
ncbi:helix-turn-helix domain-containing protein [Streptomyces sp. NPDC059578]|uniref:GbsR/MarR family transcriptional regulator n=1 Tax=unclassified Streptomyces TaxID=2593676 RepID=UPI0036514408